ncbi:MAG: hypothetical protein Q7T71_02100 [Herbiconiux sp.]|nr:hypothetical protein [Herbiconiux sp.]
MHTGNEETTRAVNRPGSEPIADTGPNFAYPYPVAALVAGIVSLFLNLLFIASIIGFICGTVGVRHARLRRDADGLEPGLSMSIAALTLSAIGALGQILFWALAFWLSRYFG